MHKKSLEEEKTVRERVIDVVAEQLGLADDEKSKITNKTSFEDLDADSLDVTNMILELEEEFDINISDDVAEKIKTVGQAVDEIEKILNEKTDD